MIIRFLYNKINKYTLVFLLFVIFGIAGYVLFTFNNDSKETSGNKNFVSENQLAYGAIEYMQTVRGNQNTGLITLSDVERAKEQLKKLPVKKSSASQWYFRGPDNIGGRTRAILIDRDNPELVFAGGVSGGLWKSTTGGQYWEPVYYSGATVNDFANLAVVSICQTINGDIYFGTGEGLYGVNGSSSVIPLWLGAGIWKSTDHGQTFEKLTSTGKEESDDTFTFVSKLAADPFDAKTVYAATKYGLKITIDGGITWSSTDMPEEEYEKMYASDVKVSSDGAVIACVGNLCFLKKKDSDEFELRSGADEDEGGSLISASDIGRLEFAFSSSDPEYVYCIASTTSSSLRNIYQSKDGGDTWMIIGKGSSELFQPLGNQGIYDMCIAVDARDKERVYIGGLDIWQGRAARTGTLFAWEPASLWTLASDNSKYVHADQHVIVVNPQTPDILYIGSDGGVSKAFIDKDNIDLQYRTLNKNYNVTQFYSVAVNNRGDLLGGSQDNGSIIITGDGNTINTGREVMGGDGGHVAMSSINPAIAFATIYYGGLKRNNDAEYKSWNWFYSSDLIDYQGWPSDGWDPSVQQAAFVTPIAYWETDNDINSEDSTFFIAKKYYPADTTIVLYSKNIYKATVEVELNREYFDGDTIWYKDPYSTLFALGMKRNIWLTRRAADFSITFGKYDWWKVLDVGVLSSDEYITNMVFSHDGNHLFFSTSENSIFRLSNLNKARTYIDADYLYGTNIITTVTKIGHINRTVTGISVDPNDINNIMVTLGNYGEDNKDYIYLCTNAVNTGYSSSMSNFIDITGNLPQAPVFCSLFEKQVGQHRVLAGTELGVFMTEELFSQVSQTAIVEWEPFQLGAGSVPVFQIVQQNKASDVSGTIYIGTHGLGFFENRTYLDVSERELSKKVENHTTIEVTVFPNPLDNYAKVSVILNKGGFTTVSVISTSGKVVDKINFGYLQSGTNTKELRVNVLSPGTYLLVVDCEGERGVVTFVKR